MSRQAIRGRNRYDLGRIDTVGTGALPAIEVTYLLVSGGGSGGGVASFAFGSGGGGAGRFFETTTEFTKGTSISLTIGAGGAAVSPSNSFGNDGTASTINNQVVHLGGGGGGKGKDSSDNSGRLGGSGGGGGAYSPGYFGNGGNPSGSLGFGNIGGFGSEYIYDPDLDAFVGSGGGGGGANTLGQAPFNNTDRANGGQGKSSNISANGSTVTYAAGGAGGAGYASLAPINGTANRGNGGSGATGFQDRNSGSGGSGIIVMRTLSSEPTATTTGSPGVTTSGIYRYYEFTGSGTITFN